MWARVEGEATGLSGLLCPLQRGQGLLCALRVIEVAKEELPALALPAPSRLLLWGCCSLVLVARVGGTKHLTLACLPSSSSGKSDRRKLGQTSPWYPVETKIFWVLLGSPILSLSTSFSSHLHILHAFLLSYISKRMGIFEGAESCQCHTQQAALAVQGHLGRGSGSIVKVACLALSPVAYSGCQCRFGTLPWEVV